MEFDGHDNEQIDEVFEKAKKVRWPVALIANTTKGKGVSFMEGHGEWHHKIPNDNEFEIILSELK